MRQYTGCPGNTWDILNIWIKNWTQIFQTKSFRFYSRTLKDCTQHHKCLMSSPSPPFIACSRSSRLNLTTCGISGSTTGSVTIGLLYSCVKLQHELILYLSLTCLQQEWVKKSKIWWEMLASSSNCHFHYRNSATCQSATVASYCYSKMKLHSTEKKCWKANMVALVRETELPNWENSILSRSALQGSELPWLA